MRFEFEDDLQFLIVSPIEDDIKHRQIKFNESYDQLMYVSQIREIINDNDFDSFILFKKDKKTFLYHEYENNENQSYFVKKEISNDKEFWEKMELLSLNHFFKNAKKKINLQKKLEKTMPTQSENSHPKM